MQLSVIIVNYNVKHYLEQCLYSVERAVLGVDAEIIVIDNHSIDNSIEWLQPLFPAVYFIRNTSNLGFARANNIALAKSTGENVLFLNPDTLVAENLVTAGLAYLAAHPDAGALGFRMIDGNGAFLAESKRSFPSPLVSFFKLGGLAALFPHSGIFNKYALGNTDPEKDQKVDVLAGACMLVKREVLNLLNGFDESYFMYGEDIDLSYRIQQLGFENHYFAGAEVLHFKGASSRSQNISYIRNFYGAMLVFVKKHYAKGAAGALSFFIKTAIAAKAVLSLAGRVFTRTVLPGTKPFSPGKILVVGSEEEYAEILAILQSCKGEKMHPERVSVDNITEGAACSLPGLYPYAQKNRVETILFCAGVLPLSVIFKQLQLPGNKNKQFLFHIKGSSHVVGTHHLSPHIVPITSSFTPIA